MVVRLIEARHFDGDGQGVAWPTPRKTNLDDPVGGLLKDAVSAKWQTIAENPQRISIRVLKPRRSMDYMDTLGPRQ